MNPEIGFPLFLILTVLLLVGALITGFKRILKLHLCFVTGAVAGLAASIWYAIRLGPLYDLEPAQPITDIHLFIAKVATISYLLPVVTGIRTLLSRTPERRKVHRICAFIVVGLTLLATVTGAWMLFLAERLP